MTTNTITLHNRDGSFLSNATVAAYYVPPAAVLCGGHFYMRHSDTLEYWFATYEVATKVPGPPTALRNQSP